MDDRKPDVFYRILPNASYTKWSTDNEQLGDPNLLIDELACEIEAIRSELAATQQKLAEAVVDAARPLMQAVPSMQANEHDRIHIVVSCGQTAALCSAFDMFDAARHGEEK